MYPVDESADVRRARFVASAVDDAVEHFSKIAPAEGGIGDDCDVTAARAFLDLAPRNGIRATPIVCSFIAFNRAWSDRHAERGGMPDDELAEEWFKEGATIVGCGWRQSYIDSPAFGLKTWEHHLGVHVNGSALYLPTIAEYGSQTFATMPDMSEFRLISFPPGEQRHPGLAVPLADGGRLVVFRHFGSKKHLDVAAWNNVELAQRIGDFADAQIGRFSALERSMENVPRLRF